MQTQDQSHTKQTLDQASRPADAADRDTEQIRDQAAASGKSDAPDDPESTDHLQDSNARS